MRRREFIFLAGGAATWSVAVQAEQPALPVLGFLHEGSLDQNVERVATLRKGLSDAGFIEGKSIAVEFRWAAGRLEKLPELAADLVQRQVAVIVTPFSTNAALAAKAITKRIPIVFVTSADPVQIGLVASLSRPGGNITGVTTLNTDIVPKRLALMSEMVPEAKQYFALINPMSKLSEGFANQLKSAAVTLGIHVVILRASNDRELGTAFADIPEGQRNVLISATDAFFFSRREHIAALAIRYGVSTSFDFASYTRAGGLMSYAADDVDLLRQCAGYVGRIIRGQRPMGLPVVQPTKFIFSINLKTARTLGLSVPVSLLAVADEVIE